MHDELGRDRSVTYIGARSFIVVFAGICALFLGLAYGAAQIAGSPEAPAPLAVTDARTAPAPSYPAQPLQVVEPPRIAAPVLTAGAPAVGSPAVGSPARHPVAMSTPGFNPPARSMVSRVVPVVGSPARLGVTLSAPVISAPALTTPARPPAVTPAHAAAPPPRSVVAKAPDGVALRVRPAAAATSFAGSRAVTNPTVFAHVSIPRTVQTPAPPPQRSPAPAPKASPPAFPAQIVPAPQAMGALPSAPKLTVAPQTLSARGGLLVPFRLAGGLTPAGAREPLAPQRGSLLVVPR